MEGELDNREMGPDTREESSARRVERPLWRNPAILVALIVGVLGVLANTIPKILEIVFGK